ncbi:uncharacterized protein [Apostichopus japonicus]|uniref:uncharacterized protein n=1 Tax=Stichopus japonicus TaxID=307972 RepID=UPI003AB61C03
MRNKLEFLVAEDLYSKWFSKGESEPISLLLNSTNVLKSSIENGIKLLTPFISVKRITTKLQKKLTNAEDVKRYLISIRQFSRDLPVNRDAMLYNENDVIKFWSDIIQYLGLHQEPAMSDNDIVEHSTVNQRSRFLELLIQCYQLVKDEGSIEKVRKVANGIDVADDTVKGVNGFKMLVNFIFDMEEFPRFDQPLMREEIVDGTMLADGANEDKGRSNEDFYTDEDDINEVNTDDLNVATDGDEVKDIDTARLEDELATKEELAVDTQEEGNDL